MHTKRDKKKLEQRRLRAAQWIKRGWTQAEVARECGVSRNAVSLWVKKLDRGGVAALRNKKKSRSR